MNKSLRDQVVEAVDRAVQLTSGKEGAPSEHALLKDVLRMVKDGRFKRRVESTDFEDTISYTVPRV